MASVLVVDDSAGDRKLAGGLLKRRPQLEVVYATNALEALATIAKAAPSIVVTAVAMPEMDALELVERIRALHPHVPVVLMTAPGNEETALKALAGGAASFVPKSAIESDLCDTVERVLDVARVEPSPKKLLRWLAESEQRFVLDNDPAGLPSLVAHLETSLAQMGLTDATGSLQVGVALREALFNAMVHGNLELTASLHAVDRDSFAHVVAARRREHPFVDRKLHLNAKLAKDAARYTIRDEGPGFDPASLPSAKDPSALARPHGRGLLLVRTFMDEVRHNERGNEITLVKRRTSPVVTEHLFEMAGIDL